MSDAESTLSLIEQDCYNMDRPDTYMIRELVAVIRLLNERIAKLEKRPHTSGRRS